MLVGSIKLQINKFTNKIKFGFNQIELQSPFTQTSF